MVFVTVPVAVVEVLPVSLSTYVIVLSLMEGTSTFQYQACLGIVYLPEVNDIANGGS